jgi:NADH-quinone oxidoreductase subunit I
MSTTTKSGAFVGYWRDLWRGIYTTCAGMKLTLGYFFTKPVTMQYPEVRPRVADGHRGVHCLDSETCTTCGQCQKACPVDCIEIKSEGKGKSAVLLEYKIDYTKCVFCNLCCEACPTKCIWMGPDWDLSSYDRESCMIDFMKRNRETMLALKWPSLIKAEQEEEARKAAKKAAAETKPGVVPKEKEED